MTLYDRIAWELKAQRKLCGLTQKIAAAHSGVGEKTISAFETGERVRSMKLSQLYDLTRLYGITLGEFFEQITEVP